MTAETPESRVAPTTSSVASSASEAAVTTATSATTSVDSTAGVDSGRPLLMRDPSFWGLIVTQFLGAFNDNLFKQIVLFVCVDLALQNRTENQQGAAAFAYALPFVLLSGSCGVLSDRYSKRTIVLLSKLLEIVVMVLGGVAFWYGSLGGLIAVLGAMGAQSALFGPSKYGILPELFRPADLPRANGWILMTTFLSIILGGILAGLLKMAWNDRLWLTSLVCVGIAVVGTLTAVPLRRTPIAQPGLRMSVDAVFVPAGIRQLLWSNTTLCTVLLVSAVFWCVGAVYQFGVVDLGRLQLELDEASTSILLAFAAVGVAAGGLLSGQLSRGRFDARLVQVGLWGMILSLSLLSCPGPFHGATLLGVGGSAVALLVLGLSAGLFAVPISTYLQAMSPASQKGQVIGVMNLCNWIGILGAAGLHYGATKLLAWWDWPFNRVFLIGVLLLVLVAALYRPRSRALAAGE